MTAKTIGTVGTIDRVLRAILGIVLIGVAIASPWAASLGAAVPWIAGIAGVVMLGTAAVKFCPLYRLLGVCT